MGTHKPGPPARGGNFFTAAIALLSLIVLAFGFASGVAQSQDDENPHERKFVDTVPAHVPIKLKLRNEKSVKDLKNKNWAREFEVEVKNTGTKPIYYVFLSLTFPEPELNILGNQQAMPLTYGRGRLGIPGNVAGPDDVPILPGETVTLKYSEKGARSYESFRDREGRPDPKKVEIYIVSVSFGDGTVFVGHKGVLEGPPKKRSENVPRPPGPAGGCRPAPRVQTAASPGRYFKAVNLTRPASFLRANFYPTDNASSPAPPAPAPRP